MSVSVPWQVQGQGHRYPNNNDLNIIHYKQTTTNASITGVPVRPHCLLKRSSSNNPNELTSTQYPTLLRFQSNFRRCNDRFYHRKKPSEFLQLHPPIDRSSSSSSSLSTHSQHILLITGVPPQLQPFRSVQVHLHSITTTSNLLIALLPSLMKVTTIITASST